MNKTNNFLVNRRELSSVKIESNSAPSFDDLETGQLLLKIDCFAFTANNITYAALGDALRYWEFFPQTQEWGNIPVWGFADVLASKCDSIAVGERLYGYYPMSTHLVVEPKNVTPNGFVDGTAHRQPLSIIYNQYIRSAQDALYTVDTEALQMLLRPLFSTSFLLDDFFEDNAFFDSDTLVLTSASSKTALGMAFLLKHNRDRRLHQYKIVGLTSASNMEFVNELGCYDSVLSYDRLSELDKSCNTSVVDFAGNGEVLGQLHSHLNKSLKYSCLVGAAHWDQRAGLPKQLPGPAPVLFFAPSQAEKRLKEWGGVEYQTRLSDVWSPFITFVGDWIQVEEHSGAGAVEHVYQEVLGGQFNPSVGFILSLWDK